MYVLIYPQIFTSSIDTPGYRTSWSCNQDRNGAFVDGGMVFNQTDRKLYVPKCGYYYVSSQVFYRVAQTQTQSVQHNIKVDRNCPLLGEDSHSHVANRRQFSLHTVASIGAGNGRDRQASSTYIGEIVKICTGGKIWVEIPQQDTPCCPYGLNTYLGAYLVAETNCHWPLSQQNNWFRDHSPLQFFSYLVFPPINNCFHNIGAN